MGMEQGGYIEGDEQGTYGYGGGGGDFNLSMGAGGDSFAVDYASMYAPIDYAPYEPQWGLEPPTFEPLPQSPLPDLPFFPGISQEDLAFAWEERFAEQGGFETFDKDYFGKYEVVPDTLPVAPYEQSWPIEEPRYFELPFVPYVQSWPIEEPKYFELPPPPPKTTPKLPPACAGGTYHPYPIGHPDQNKCVPFPPAQLGSSPQAQPKPAAPSGGGSSTSKPPAQQQQKCPTGYFLDPTTKQCRPIPQEQPQSCPTGYYRASSGQCLPIPKCTTTGTVFDQAIGLCVPRGQAISPLPEGVEGLFDELSKLPWWIWLALGGLLLLSRDGEDGKKTTVTYRRAR